jgi:CubicO group peptidase (beta-lactamase class C family)
MYVFRLNGTRLADKFGPMVSKLTVHHLLHMTSGLPDYDTSWVKGDPWRSRQFAHPDHDYGPVEILSSINGQMNFAPGARQDYCSTNFILLGLILAQYYNASSWDAYDQKRTSIPAALLQAYPFSRTTFVEHGQCAKYLPVHGYDMYIDLNKDVWNVSCLGGWTAGNVVSSVGDIAFWTHALYGGMPSLPVVSPSMQATMRNTSLSCDPISTPHCYGITHDGYGLSTFNLTRATGVPLPEGESWGHLGSTYGYQSMSNYFPALNLTIVVATNIELQQQDQPSDTMCSAFNAALNLIHGRPAPSCSFGRSGYFFGNCTCTTGAGN